VNSSLPHQEGTSPPEAAIEATPETTPIKVQAYGKAIAFKSSSIFSHLCDYIFKLSYSFMKGTEYFV
jgi:hypothetical protein